MRRFLDLPTRHKLSLGFGVLFLFLLATMATAYRGLRAMEASQQRLFEVDFATAQDAWALRGALDSSRGALLTMMVQRSRAGQKVWHQETLARAKDAETMMERLLAKAPNGTELHARVTQLQQILRAYNSLRDRQLIPAIYAGDPEGARRLFLGVQTEYYQRIRERAEELSAATQQSAAAALKESQRQADLAVAYFGVIGALTMVSGVLMIVFLSRIIAVPLGRVSQVARRIAEGDLAVEVVTSQRGDEVGVLEQSFALMTRSLQDLARVADEVVADVDAHITPRSENDVLAKAFAALDLQATELRRHNAHVAADLRMAREIQTALLPLEPTQLAAPDSGLIFKFDHRYLPATQLAGDFFDVLPISPHQIGIFICDVMGHGVRAALVTAMISTLLSEGRDCAGDPAHFLAQINRALTASLRRSRTSIFATAFYGVADAQNQTLRYVNAGHPLPFLVRGPDRMAQPMGDISGPALGVFEDADFPLGEQVLQAGDWLLAYTDGLTEAQNARGEEYGEARLVELARDSNFVDAAAWLDAILQDAQRFRGGAEFEDDVCLVGLEVGRASLD